MFVVDRRGAGQLRKMGGSHCDNWNARLANQVAQSAWTGNANDAEERNRLGTAGLSAVVGSKPQDEIEAMLLAQMVAAHNAAMESFRRAMLPEQTVDGRSMNLGHAGKLSRTCVALVEGLTRYRGKGQQVVRVEHVNIAPGAQAVIGNVTTGGQNGISGQSHAPALEPAGRVPTLRSQDAEREALPVTGNDERPLSDARRE